MGLKQFLALKVAAIAATFFCAALPATEYQLKYSQLYSHLKFQDDEKYPDLSIGYFMFSPLTGQICDIQKAWMAKDSNREDFTIPKSQQVPIPIDAHLRKVNPSVYVQTYLDGCDMLYQILVARKFEHEITKQDLQDLETQFGELLTDMGGFWGQWFMPEPKGIVLHFVEPVERLMTNSGKTLPVDNQQIKLSSRMLNNDEVILLTTPLLKLVPWLSS